MDFGGGDFGADYFGGDLFEDATSAGDEQQARLLGSDIYFRGDYRVTPDGDWKTVRGLAALRQAVYHRLITRPGEYRARPDYGCGVLDWVKQPKTPANLASLATRIRTQLLRDSRIDDVRVTVTDLDGTLPGLDVTVAVAARGRSITLGSFKLSDA
jgi:phage baseplate assembly protein W